MLIKDKDSENQERLKAETNDWGSCEGHHSGILQMVLTSDTRRAKHEYFCDDLRKKRRIGT